MEQTKVKCPYCGAFLVRIVYAPEAKCVAPDCGYVVWWDQLCNLYAKHEA